MTTLLVVMVPHTMLSQVWSYLGEVIFNMLVLVGFVLLNVE